MGVAMLELKNVCKFYTTKDGRSSEVGLDSISATFKVGEVSSILGADGSGKTTLLNVISGLDKQSSGEIFFDGVSNKNFSSSKLDALRAKDISIISSTPDLIDHMNVLENVMSAFAFKRSKSASAPIKKRVQEALELVGLGDKSKTNIENLTFAQKQRVAIARAIAKDSKFILADEPTAILKEEESYEVLNILKKAALERVVIVTTHSKEVANFLNGPIFEMNDGKLSVLFPGHDTSVILQSRTNVNNSLSCRLGVFKGATYALSNMRIHKLRTALTILAMSIGIIGICTVLALSTGLSAYVNHVEETTLSSTPITISKYKLSTGTTKSQEEQEKVTAVETQDKETKRAQYLSDAANNRRIALNNTIASMFSSNGNQNTEGASLLNDVPSLKTYLDTNPDGIQEATSSIEYTYDTSPIIYSTANDTISEVYPGGLFGSLGTGSSSTKGSKASMTSSAYSIQNYLSDFKVLPNNTQIYQDSDSIVEGKWPQNSDEAVLVLNSDGTMDDSLAYTLGLKNFSEEISPLIEKYKNGEKVDFPGIYDSWAYSDVIGITFKVVTSSDVYQKQADGTWKDMSSDNEFMNNLVKNNSSELKIVGVVIPADGSKASATLNPGIYYTPDLNTKNNEDAASSEIVKEQLANPDVDVLTGKTFAWLKQASTISDRVDFSNLVNFNADALANSVTLHPEVLEWDEKAEEVENEVQLSDEEIEKMTLELLSDPEFQQFIEDMSSAPTFDEDVQTVLARAGAAYAEYCAEEMLAGRTPQSADVWFSEAGDGYAYTLWAQTVLPDSLSEDICKFVAKYAQKVSTFIATSVETEINNLIVDLQNELNSEQEEDGPSLIEFDEQKFQESLKINITEEDITQLGYYLCGDTSHTYSSNLADFGYTTEDTPITCTIYPNSFSDKEKITSVLDKYNNQKRAEDKESEAISYTDAVGTITSLVESAIKIVSGFLIAVLGYSLISVILLIAVISAISTFQRSREIGVLRALGATKRDIFTLFDSEALLFGFLSSVFSVIVSAIICSIINGATQNSTIAFSIAQLTPQIVIGAIVICTLVSAIAGIIPSLFACRRK